MVTRVSIRPIIKAWWLQRYGPGYVGMLPYSTEFYLFASATLFAVAWILWILGEDE